MRPRVALLGALALAAAGCRGNCDLVESELRAKDADLRELRAELGHCVATNQAMQMELKALRGEPPVPGEAAAASADVYPVKSLTLGRGTGGRGEGDCAGDNALQVNLEPRDGAGQVVRAPGSVLINAAEVTPEGLKRPLSTWEIPPDDLRRAWKAGLLGSSYALVLPWKVWPSTEKIRVTAQFRVADGRLFEADKDVTIHLAPPDKRPAPAPAPAPAAPPTPLGEELLPPPRRVEPGQDGPSLKPAAARLGGPVRTTSARPPAADLLRPLPAR
jgi:hypothetical protein